MGLRILSRGAAACVVLTLAAGAARADELTDQAQALVDSRQSAQAYALLAPQTAARAGDPEFDYLLGVAAIDTGRPAEAVAAFERTLAVDPQHLQARAELGRAYIALNELEAARRELSAVSGQNVPPAVREAVDRYVTALNDSLGGGGAEIEGELRVTAGYDSNVNNSTSDNRILIPAFAGLGFGTLSPSAVAQDDGFGEVMGRVAFSQGLAIDRRLIGDMSVTTRGNFDVSGFDQTIFGANLGIAQATPDHGVFTISAQTQGYWVGGDDYRWALGGLGQWNTRTRGGTDIGAYALYSNLSYPGNSPMDADRYILGVTAGRPLGGALQPYVYAGAYGGLEEAKDPAFDNITYWFAGARIGGEITLQGGTSVYGNLAIEQSDYDDPEPLFLTPRETTRIDAAAGVRHALTGALTLGAEVAYTNADSNIVLYDYDRVVASLSLTTRF